MNYTISMTDILLAVSVGCNLWFLFLLLYERIMDTRIVRFFKGGIHPDNRCHTDARSRHFGKRH